MPLTPLWTLLRKAPAWVWAGALGVTVFPLTLFALGTGMPFGRSVDILASAARLLLEGALFLWAGARIELPSRLRSALKLTGWASVLTAINYLAILPPQLGGPTLITESVDDLWTFLAYVAATAALFVYPRRPQRPGERSPLLLDLLITTGGFGLIGWTLVTVPSAASADTAYAFRGVVLFGIVQALLLVGLNVVVVRGLKVPSRRAFWWFVAGQAAYIPVVVLAQFDRAGFTDPLWGSAFYYLGVLPTAAGALAMRADPLAATPESGGPSWLRDFNPLPLAAVVAVSACLLTVLVGGPPQYAVQLAATLVAVSLLLAVRLLLSAHDAAALARADADKERRRHVEKLQAVGRLAGGVAHEFNNLMARVVGHAELGEAAVGPDHTARENFAKVKVAALRAAELTRQLLAFSGQQRTHLAPVDVEATVRAVAGQAERALPSGIECRLQIGAGPFLVHGDDAQLAAALEQVIENAVEAMPRGGRLELAVTRERLQDPLATPLLSVPPGQYVTLSVRDTGVGMPEASLAVVCDPFYSTKPPHLAAGLGLASVHGIMASHSGGLLIESRVGEGTRVSLYLPSR